jgi:NAD(P)-dependent dehydrogenase (short-subunit alcohol dehydrogenase family)
MSGITILVTGSNRGIGLGLVERLLVNPAVDIVFAAARHADSPTLLELVEKFGKKIVPIKMELDEKGAAVYLSLNISKSPL